MPGVRLSSIAAHSLLLQEHDEVCRHHRFSNDIWLTISAEADLVQDLYLKELKNYKPPPLKPSDSDGHVQKFTPPKAPQSPEESDIANDLKAYEDQQVELEGQAAGGESSATEMDWFEEDEEEEAHPAH